MLEIHAQADYYAQWIHSSNKETKTDRYSLMSLYNHTDQD